MSERVQAKRYLWAVAVIPLLLVSLAIVSAVRSGASTTFTFTRLAGADRYDTARVIAEQTFTVAPSVVLATGEAFPDALAGGYVAGLGGAPILLTTLDTTPAATSTALKDLKTTNILILGGYSAISQTQEANLQSQGFTTRRLAGADRYDTAKQAAESGGANSVGTYNNQVAAIVASGDNLHFADALSSSPIAFSKHFPTLLTAIDALPATTKTALTDLNVKYVFVPGGTAAVSDAVVAQIQQMGITVQRIAGADRTETAALLATFEQQNLGFSSSHVNLARGDAFPDSLTGGPHAGHDGPAGILLTSNPTTLGSPTGAWLQAHAQPLNNGHIFGGTAAVSDTVKTQAEGIVTGNSAPTCATTTTNPLPLGSTTTTNCVPGTSTTAAPATTTTTANPNCNPGPSPFCFPTTTTTAPPAQPLFTGGSANSSGPTTTTTNPLQVSPPANNQLVVTYNEPIVCSSVDPPGSDYLVTYIPNGGGSAQTAPINNAQCYSSTASPTTSQQVILTLTSGHFTANQYVTVTAQTGLDGNTVTDGSGHQQPPGDQTKFYVS